MAVYDDNKSDTPSTASGKKHPGSNSAAEDLARQEGLGKPLSNEHGDNTGKNVASPGLNKAEQLGGKFGNSLASDTIGPGFVPESGNTDSKGSGLKKIFWGSRVKRNSTITAIIVALLFGGGFGASLYFSGPFEYVQIAKLLEGFHLTTQENEQNDRFVKEVRFIRYTAANEGQRTRLSFLGLSLIHI